VVLGLFGASGFVRACATPAPAPAPAPVTATNDVLKVANACTTLVNKERAARGLKAVAVELRVQNAAQLHSTYQASIRTMTHKNAKGADAGARLLAAGYKWRTWAENVAAGQTGCTPVMSAWMNSPGHKANILNPAMVHIGVAAAKGSNGVLYWTMDLAAP
jgi:uncharacterized protein YkwD